MARRCITTNTMLPYALCFSKPIKIYTRKRNRQPGGGQDVEGVKNSSPAMSTRSAGQPSTAAVETVPQAKYHCTSPAAWFCSKRRRPRASMAFVVSSVAAQRFPSFACTMSALACPVHVPSMSCPCPVLVSRPCPVHVPSMSRPCPVRVPSMSCPCSVHVPSMSVPSMSRPVPSRPCPVLSRPVLDRPQ